MSSSQHAYEIRPRKDRRRILIGERLPLRVLWFEGADAIDGAGRIQSETIQRRSARSSAVLLKRKARASLSSDRPRSFKSVIVVRPPALPILGSVKES